MAVLRTFSKAYGLAGLRVGFLIGHEPVATGGAQDHAAVHGELAGPGRGRSPRWRPRPSCWSGSSTVVKERDRVRDELLGQGWTVPPTEANFVWLPLGARHPRLRRGLRRGRGSVRPYPPDGVRVTIGEPEANDAFLAVARAWPRQH